MRAFAAFIVMVVIGSSAMAAAPSEKDKIDYLLGQLASSDVTFVRNGEDHTGAWGKDHLEQKMKDANKPDMTAEDFIADIASKSSHTDKPYLIKARDGTTVEAGQWLKEKLAQMPAQ
jgi:hypothetical protein